MKMMIMMGDDGSNMQFDLPCEMLEPGQIIALCTDRNKRQSFYLMIVVEVIKEGLKNI